MSYTARAMNALSCRTCGAPLNADDLDRRLAIIGCRSCGAIFDLARRKDREDGVAQLAREPAPERAPVALPQGFELSTRDGHLRITRRWFNLPELVLIPFAVAWNAFLVGWYATALGNDMPGGMNIIMLVFPVVHVAVGVGVAYRAVANLVNRTTLLVTPAALAVRHLPLPWWPAPSVPVGEVEQLYCTRNVRHGKNGTSVTFELRAVTREHASLLLIGGLPDLDHALWMEQEIERHLDLRDRPVAGEVREREA